MQSSKTDGLLAAALGLLAAPGLAAPQDSAPAVHMAVSSWGVLISEWTVHSDGSGDFSSSPPMPGDIRNRVLVKKQLSAAAGRFDQLTEMLRPAEAYAGKELPCPTRMTDLPYGEISWRTARVNGGFHFDSGCGGAETTKVLHQLQAAQALVAQWAASAPVADDAKPADPGPPR